jgi:hypothetical protein
MAPLSALLVAGALATAAVASGCTCDRASTPGAAGPRDSLASAASATPGAAVLRASALCGIESREASVRWIATEEEYQAALAALDQGRLPGAAPAIAAVDFATHGVLLVQMGRRPTAGYALDLATEQVVTEGGVGVVRVNWVEPLEDAVVAQVLTSPCLLVSVRKEQLRSVKVVDQAGRTRETVELR